MDEASAEAGGFTKQAYGPHKGPVMKVRIVIPIFQKRKLRPKEAKWLILGNTVRMSLIRGSQAFPQGLPQGAQHPSGSESSCQNQWRPSPGRSNYAIVIR